MYRRVVTCFVDALNVFYSIRYNNIFALVMLYIVGGLAQNRTTSNISINIHHIVAYKHIQ